jgi:hypothetical protein
MLRPRDRDTISGDLLEIYVEEKLPELGPFRANLWYARQLLSILPHRILSTLGGSLMRALKPLWTAASIFLVLACSWSAVMELILKHPGFMIRAGVCALIVFYAALCIGLTLAYNRIPSTPLRYGLSLFALATLVFGVSALATILRSPHFEGYIFLMALGLIAQSLLTLFNTLARPRLHTVISR